MIGADDPKAPYNLVADAIRDLKHEDFRGLIELLESVEFVALSDGGFAWVIR